MITPIHTYPSIKKTDILFETIQHISKICIEKKLSIASAESVTSGAIQYLLSQAENCTLFYQGGLTVYNNDQKFQLLSIPKELTAKNYAVSEEVAKSMAISVAHHYQTDIGLGITGFAVKDEICQHLHAFVAISHGNIIVQKRKLKVYMDDKLTNQFYYAMKSLMLLDSYLIDKYKESL